MRSPTRQGPTAGRALPPRSGTPRPSTPRFLLVMEGEEVADQSHIDPCRQVLGDPRCAAIIAAGIKRSLVEWRQRDGAASELRLGARLGKNDPGCEHAIL